MTGDVITDFVAAMRQHGLEPAEEADGKLRRVGWRQGKPGTCNAAYALHLNGYPASFVECFRRMAHLVCDEDGIVLLRGRAPK
jgi:hypothetical protein